MPALKLDEPVDFHLSARYFRFNRHHAVRDVFDALVELITNSDDSYHRLHKHGSISSDGGRILIEYCEQRNDEPSYLRVHDRAEGMTIAEMHEKLADVGTKRSESGDRGFMARGVKDCTALGTLTVESIKDDYYYKCELTQAGKFIARARDKNPSRDLREQLSIPRRNGTVVTLQIGPEHRFPRFDTLARDLPWHYALRSIMSATSDTEVLLRRDSNANSKPMRLFRPEQKGTKVVDVTVDVEDYPDVTANLEIWRADEPLGDSGDKFREHGLIIKGIRAIHECSLLSPEIERDANSRRYFGTLSCPAIDDLLEEYDGRSHLGLPMTAENPCPIIDPNRQSGLDRAHPFVSKLLQQPIRHLQALLAKDREAQRSHQKEISNQETRSRLDRLGKAATKFLYEQVEDLNELTAEGEKGDSDAISKIGILIYPTYGRILVKDERRFTCYMHSKFVKQPNPVVQITSDSDAVAVLTPTIELHPHPSKPHIFTGGLEVRGDRAHSSVVVSAQYEDLPNAESCIEVVESVQMQHEFAEPLEFERSQYRVVRGKSKSLWVYAKVPDVISEETVIEITSSNSECVRIRGRCRLVPIEGTNFARGAIRVEGRKLSKRSVCVAADINGFHAEANMRVVDDNEAGAPIRIELRDEDFSNYRAKWADDENKPNLLLVSARHDSLKRYLGPSPAFEGQATVHFRILLAEIVGESVCRKSLGLEAKANPWEFELADLKEDHIIADTVLAALHKRVRSFVTVAHEIMLGDRELRRLSQNGQV